MEKLIRRMVACGVPEDRARRIAEGFRGHLRLLRACVRSLEVACDG